MNIFKKEFDSFFLVPLKTLEAKMLKYVGLSSAPTQSTLTSFAED
jgi:hypothetical protein